MTAATTMTSATGKTRRRNRQGFSLIEVLVSVVILSTGIVAVLYSFDASISALAASRDGMRIDLLLRQKLDEVLWKGLPPASGGAFAGSDSEFSWQVSTTPVSASQQPGLNEVVVSAWREEGGGKRQLVTRIRLDRYR